VSLGARGALAALFGLLLALTAVGAGAAERYGFATLGRLKYGPDFSHFDYANPDAPKGGEIVRWFQGSFDSLQPFLLKGVPAAGSNPFLAGGSLLTYESLMDPALDEPDSYYGLIAKSVEIPDDRQSVTFTLRPEARFHDGSPITAEDVVFSFQALQSEAANPVYRVLFRDIDGVRALAPDKVRFVFKPGVLTRDLPGYVATMPILSKAYYDGHDFAKTTLQPPLASGPYRIVAVDAGRSITYERVKDHWAKDLPVYRGRFNFDRIRFDYYRDRTIGLQALFAGKVDFREEFTSRDWATRYDTPAVHDGRIKREELPDRAPSGTQAFLFNLRRDKFADRRVREALLLAFDFEWTNSNLFYDAYKRTTSMFENSELAAKAPPTPDEIALLEPYRDRLPPEAFREPFTPPANHGKGDIRDHLRQASALLAEAGWSLRQGRRVSASGEPFEIEFLSYEQGFERIVLPYVQNLKRLGIEASFRLVEPAQYQQRVITFDFDAITNRYGGSLTPGVRLRSLWGSADADVPGGLNYAGVKDPAVDALIETCIAATTRAELTTAARALDRVVMWNYYMVPQWFNDTHRIAYWDIFGRPTVQPKYDLGFDTWWIDPKREARLADRR
jgi:microcin C transport system substrate-binding protein